MKAFRSRWISYLLLVVFIFESTARPLIRNVMTHRDFKKLIDHHRDNTGLPVVVDFFSETCGPCRMIAPHFKQLAKQYKNKAVFAKVDVNINRETSSKQKIGSMPTFQFFLDGKMKQQFSGANGERLQQFVEKYANDAETANVKLSKDDLLAYYKKHSPEKASTEQIDKLLAKAGGENGGTGHRKLWKALKEKYGEAPKLSKRFDNSPDESKSKVAAKLSTAALAEELMKRGEEGREMFGCPAETDLDEDADDDEDGEEDHLFQEWEADNRYAERVAVVGGGPAGLSAALYLARAGLRPVVVAPRGGGQLQAKGVLVENFPGAAEATGAEVVYSMMKQAARFGAVFAFGDALELDLSDEPFKKLRVKLYEFDEQGKETTREQWLKSQSVVIATGADARWLYVPGEQELRGNGVSACATCDGFLFRDKQVVVIGGGDTAMEEALHLSGIAEKVYILNRGSSLRASNILKKRAEEMDNIEIKYNTTVQEFGGRKTLVSSHAHEDLTVEELEKMEARNLEEPDPEAREGFILSNMKILTNGQLEELSIDGAFIAIGHTPNVNFLGEEIQMNPNGHIHLTDGRTGTTVPGVFACGDVADFRYRQAITASGTGAMAALDAEKWLMEKGFRDERLEAEKELLREVLNDQGRLA